MFKKIILGSCLLLFGVLQAQNVVGVVLEVSSETKKDIPVMGANVFWLNTSVGTITDLDGRFEIPESKETHLLVVSYVGFETDTIAVHRNKNVKHILKSKNELDEVTVTATQ